ncbi:hypothetical protein ABIC83_002998 [Roseateles asaccharophilus]
MRYQVFNTAEGGKPVCSAPWKWLAQMLCLRASTRWYWYRLVDTRTGKTLVEWARAKPYRPQ